MKKAEMEKLIQANGGKIAGSVSGAVTHVIATDTSTGKAVEAQNKGKKLVKESFLQASIDAGKPVEEGNVWSGGGDVDVTDDKAEKNTTAKKRKQKTEEEDDDGGDDGESKNKTTKKGKTAHTDTDSAGGMVFAGLTFCLSGKLSQSKAEVEKLIKSNGGKVAGSVTSAVTHVIAAEEGTAKAQEATDKGLPVVKESWLDACVAAGKKIDVSKHTLSGGDDGEGDGEGGEGGEGGECGEGGEGGEDADEDEIQEMCEALDSCDSTSETIVARNKALDIAEKFCGKGEPAMEAVTESGALEHIIQACQAANDPKAVLSDDEKKFVARCHELVKTYYPSYNKAILRQEGEDSGDE